MQTTELLQTFQSLTSISPFRRTNITCTFPFHQPLAAASPSTNRPKSKSRYLAIVSLKHGRLVRIRSQYSLFRRSPTRQNLPPATFDASERLHYGSPFAPVQSLEAVLGTENCNFYKKACLCRALNRSPGVQRTAALGLLLVTFRRGEK